MIGASQGAGVFSSAPTDQNVLSIQLFLLVLSVSLLSLAILIAEREKSTPVKNGTFSELESPGYLLRLGFWIDEI